MTIGLTKEIILLSLLTLNCKWSVFRSGTLITPYCSRLTSNLRSLYENSIEFTFYPNLRGPLNKGYSLTLDFLPIIVLWIVIYLFEMFLMM